MRSHVVALFALAGACSLLREGKQVAKLVAHGEARELRPARQRERRTAATERRHRLLVIGIDGIDRDLLYDMLHRGQLPGLASFLGGRTADGALPHAHLDSRVLSVMPSSTIPAWASLFTAQPPGVHGLAGNEVFVRERRELVAPAPVSFQDATPTLQCYTGDYADDQLTVPTIYEQIRARDPGVVVWVAMSQFHRGADKLILARRSVLGDEFGAFLSTAVAGNKSDDDKMEAYAAIDREELAAVGDQIESVKPGAPLPDLLTIYLPGADLFAHKAAADPDVARTRYLVRVLDPSFRELHRRMAARGALADRFVVVVSDHGHTDVLQDDRHALGSGKAGEPPDVLRAAGFRVREKSWKVADDADYQAVIANGGATAYVYLADRSLCPARGQRCDFTRPPRFEEDVLPAADAFFRSSRDGAPVPAMRGTIDMVLTRRPRPFGEEDAPFQVYVGDGRLEDVSLYLAHAPHPTYVELASRLAQLATGPRGERAGDVMLIARDSAEHVVADRFYFSGTYESWHGSPSRKDSEVPLILAHPAMTSDALAALAARGLGPAPRLDDVGRLLVRLRLDTP